MPKIRKKTSRRGTSAQRAKIKHKVTESRKKAKKAAKKDVTWKSKKTKDPGIPNSFPYKDQILAEIAEERRQTAEAKERRKEEKKALRAQQKASTLGAKGKHDDSDGESADVEDDAEGGGGGFDGVATFDGRAKKAPSKSKKSSCGAGGAAPTTEEANGAPLLMNPELPHLAAVLDKADVVIEILDARDPLAHRSGALEAQVSLKEGQMLLLVLNKIDGCPREPTAAWAAHLRAEHPTLLFRAASSFLPRNDPTNGKGKEKEPLDDAWGADAVCTLLGRRAHEKKAGGDDGPLHVAVVGLTNSGKSAFVNSLTRNATLDVYAPSSSTKSPTTTPYALEATLELDGKPVVFIDTPGLAWHPSEGDASPEDRARLRAQDILLRNKGRIDHLKDPIPAVSYVVSRAETEDLMVHYCLPAFAKGDVDAFLSGVARANALIKKGGDPDLVGAARLVLRDWSTGKLPRYAVPPPPIARQQQQEEGIAAAADGDPTLAAIYADDAALLKRLVPRKELRRSRDVVRLSPGRLDERALAFEAPWSGSATAESDDAEEDEVGDGYETTESDARASVSAGGGGGGGGNGNGNGSDDEAEGDGNEDEEEGRGEALGTTTRSTSARKRKLPALSKPHMVEPARPNKKKVSFAATAKTLSTPSSAKGRSALRQASASTIAAASEPLSKQNRNMTTPDLAMAYASKKNNAKKVKIALGSSPSPPAHSPASAAQSATRRTGALKPAANAPTTAQKRKNQAAVASEEGAYDFSKFF